MSSNGKIVLVLHSHIPYVRLAGRWPHGEEWLYEAVCETYIPLLKMLFGLIEENTSFNFTLGITPVLAEQLQDEFILQGVETYINSRIQLIQQDILKFEGNYQLADENNYVDANLLKLARWYLRYYSDIKHTFIDQFKRDLIGQFRWLQDHDYIEIMTSTATHNFLPLYNANLRRGQIETAISSYVRLFNRKPEVFWLPECGYPSSTQESTAVETQLGDAGIKLFFAESHALDPDFSPHEVQDFEADQLMNSLQWQGDDSHLNSSKPEDIKAFKSYKVEMNSERHPKLHVIARNSSISQRVWSRFSGYPGNAVYRDFHKSAHTSGMKYWKITDVSADFSEKHYYDPQVGMQQAYDDGRRFVVEIDNALKLYRQIADDTGMICIAFDTELFGHWWFEGIAFLQEVLTAIDKHPDLSLVAGGAYVSENHNSESVTLTASSWGLGGGDWVWKNSENAWVHEKVEKAYQDFLTVARKLRVDDGLKIVLNQMCRELLIAQSSDWLFLITTKQAGAYATERIETHLSRYNELLEAVKAGNDAVGLAKKYFELDNLFTDIDYRWFLP